MLTFANHVVKNKRNFSPKYALERVLTPNILRVCLSNTPERSSTRTASVTKSDRINRVSIDANKRCCMLDLTTHTNLSYQAGSGILHGIVNGTSCRQRPPRCTKNKIKTALIKTANISFFS